MLSGNKKYANEILDDVECYKAVLDGRLKRFPKGFWTKPWSLESAAVITRYLLEERLKYTEEDIKTKVGGQLFADNKLSTLISLLGGSSYNIIENAYPGRFKPWEMAFVPLRFWKDKNNIIDAVRWLVETKLDNNRERVCKEFNKDLLMDNGFYTILRHGVYNLINMAYPNEFKPWELNIVPNRFWDKDENTKEAVRWLVKTKLGNDRNRVCKEFNRKLLNECGLSTISRKGIYNLLNLVYPNEFKPWELVCTQQGFWDKEENIIHAVKWIVENKLDNNKERVKKEFSGKLLMDNGLTTLRGFGIYKLINMAYPNEFKPWEFNQVTQGYWDKEENIRDAVKWIVENKLDNNKERVRKEFNRKLLMDNGLTTLTELGVYNILNIAYPNEFNPEDFKCGVKKRY